MVNFTKLENIGVVADVDLSTLSDESCKQLLTYAANDEVVVIKRQQIDANTFLNCLKNNVTYSNSYSWCSHPDHPEIFRVTNKLVDKKNMGFFGNGKLDWHCNSPISPDPEQCVALWCIDPGIDSITSFCDVRKAWNDLSTEIQDVYKKYTITLKFRNKAFYDYTPKELKEATKSILKRYKNYQSTRVTNLIGIHPYTGKEYMYFPYTSILKINELDQESSDKTINFLRDHVLQDKYIYHHHWDKGDVLLFDQLVGIHRRTDPNLKDAGSVKGKRELYRTIFWYGDHND